MNFETAIERILAHEGGYVNNPRDPGGETQWGISKRSYPAVDIRALTREGAKAIYERDFWRPVVSTVADGALQYQLMDSAVNHGMGNAVRSWQRRDEAEQQAIRARAAQVRQLAGDGRL